LKTPAWPWQALNRTTGDQIRDAPRHRGTALKLGGWPLPAAGGRPWRCTRVRPNRSSAVGSENTR